MSFTKEILLAPNSAHPWGSVLERDAQRVPCSVVFKEFFCYACAACAGRRAEVGEKDISSGGSTPALSRWRWSMGRSRTALVHLLWPTAFWRRAHTASVLLACLISYSPVQLRWLLRGKVG